MTRAWTQRTQAWILFTVFAVVTLVIYGSGLNGGYQFDDFPNIVDNDGVRPPDASIGSLVRSALSSPSSEFKRPLASLTFAANYLATGGDPAPMKVTNIVIHLVNGIMAFMLCSLLVRAAEKKTASVRTSAWAPAFIAGLWMLLPINLTAVLYIVQRMESLANLFVFAGLAGYVHARLRMQISMQARWPVAAAAYVLVGTAMGLLAKETAIMLPLYAFVTDACLFGFRSLRTAGSHPARDKRVVVAFVLVLFVPLVAGLCWLLPGLLSPSGWSTRDFTLGTRLLTELRVVTAYIGWTLVPTPGALSFYHDDWSISTNLLTPWTTLASLAVLAALAVVAWLVRRRYPLATLGIALFFGAQALTGTILPLELVYEHRNYFASLGLLLAIVPPLVATRRPAPLVRGMLLASITMQSVVMLYITARAWDNPLTLAQELAERAPDSPRAQYELGRTYIILSHYDATSPFAPLVYVPLERAARLPGSSILPEQALIFFNARMHLAVKEEWWRTINAKLAGKKVTVQDESSLGALAQCLRQGLCPISKQRMLEAFLAALSHPAPSARLLAMYGDFAWNTLEDHKMGLLASTDAMNANRGEPAYRITVIRMLIVEGRLDEARDALAVLERMNVGGSLDGTLKDLRNQIPHSTIATPST